MGSCLSPSPAAGLRLCIWCTGRGYCLLDADLRPVCIHLDTDRVIRPETCTHGCVLNQKIALRGPTILDKYEKGNEKCRRQVFIHTILTDPGLSPEDCHLLPKLRPGGHKWTGGPPPVSYFYAIVHSSLVNDYELLAEIDIGSIGQ